MTCPAQNAKQRCACSNNTAAGRNCSCTRPDNGIVGSFRFPDSNCLCGSRIPNTTNTDCECCVSQTLVDTQIPRKSCDAEGPSFAPEFCQCTVPPAVNRVPSATLNCSCSRPEFMISRQYNIPTGSCLNTTATRYECCLNTEQRAALIPRLSCDASQIP